MWAASYRTIWLVLSGQEHIYAEYNAAFPFAIKDITTLVFPDAEIQADGILNKPLEVLHGLLPHWPIASRWLEALRKVACWMQMESQARFRLNTIKSTAYLIPETGEIKKADTRPNISEPSCGVEQFSAGVEYVNFNFALDFDGQFLQFL